MYFLLLFALFPVLAVGTPPPEGQKERGKTRIINGTIGIIEEFPYLVSIEKMIENGKFEHNCGGSIISPLFIVTAAHCTKQYVPDELKVRAGATIKQIGGAVYYVAQKFEHPNFRTRVYDIAILKLSDPIQFSTGVQPIRMAGKNDVLADGTRVVISGWGQTLVVPRSPRLQYAVLHVFNREKCAEIYKTIDSDLHSKSSFCAADAENARDTCQGDSGGPIVGEGKLFGVVSWGNGCSVDGFPGVYTDLPACRDWIRGVSGI